jgi:hypothetical protein
MHKTRQTIMRPEEIEMLFALRQEGKTWIFIEAKMGYSTRTLRRAYALKGGNLSDGPRARHTEVKDEHLDLVREMRLAGKSWDEIEAAQPYYRSTIQHAYYAKFGPDLAAPRRLSLTTSWPAELYHFIQNHGSHEYLRTLVMRDMEGKPCPSTT